MDKIFRHISYRLSVLLHGIYRPKMLYKKQNFQGKRITGLRIGSSTFIDHPEQLFLADHVYIGHHNFIEASNKIVIGTGCQITSFVSITSHSSHHAIRLYGSSYGSVAEKIGYETGTIEIGDFTFIGPHVTIMPGTVIGKGCIVAAYSLVKGNFPDYSVIAGNPAQVVKRVEDTDKKYLEQHPELVNLYMK